MWEQYESPEEKRATAAEFAPAAAPIRAGGTRSGVGVAVCVVGFILSAGVAIGVGSSAEDAQPPGQEHGPLACPVDADGNAIEEDDEFCHDLLDGFGEEDEVPGLGSGLGDESGY